MPQTEFSWRARPSGVMALSIGFVISTLLLFAALYLLTDRYLVHQVDERLLGEVKEFHDIGRADAVSEIGALSQRDVARSRPYGAFDHDGAWLSGNIRKLAQVEPAKPFNYTQADADGHPHYYRGIVVPTTSQLYIVVGHETDEIRAFDQMLLKVLGGGVAAMLLLALVFAIGMSRLSNRRIREIGASAQEIMSGDLSQRLPAGNGNHDLDRLAVIVNAMLDEIERLVAEVRGVCAGIAHDLRTPMTHLRAGIERARRRGGSAQDYELALDTALGQADVVLNRFTALLRIAEVEASERRERFGDVRLDVLVHDVAELYEPLAEGRGIKLWTEVDGAQTVQGDVDLLFGAVENLLDNALKFTPIGGVVGLQLRRAPTGSMRLAVLDSGPGIAEHEREAVLQPFYRSVGQLGTTEGHGLGLSLVAAVARVHGAILEIHDNYPGCRIELHFGGE